MKLRINPSLIGGGLLTSGCLKFFLGQNIIPVWATTTSLILGFVFFGIAIIREILRIIQEFKRSKLENKLFLSDIEYKTSLEKEMIQHIKTGKYSLEEINLARNEKLSELVKESIYSEAIDEHQKQNRKKEFADSPTKIIASAS